MLVQAGLNSTYSAATSDGYERQFSQWRNSIYCLLKLSSFDHSNRFLLSLRKEMIDDKVIYPSITINDKKYNYEILPTASIGYDSDIFKWLSLKLNASTIYRVPTLNDLYWNPGGNKDLKPEEGASEEITLSVNIGKKINAGYDVTAFNRNVNNWIIWLPGDYYWSPENIMKVWSRGFEHAAFIGFKKNKFSIKLDLNYTYTLSTSEKEKTANDASLHKQLIYVPVHQSSGKLNVIYGKWFLSYLHSYTGYRYTSTDNKEHLPEYDISKLSAGRSFTFKKIELSINVFCNNLLDEKYQSVLWRAMPGRSYGASLKINFNHKQKQ
jgi:iron complex outermembrane receptor protein